MIIQEGLFYATLKTVMINRKHRFRGHNSVQKVKAKPTRGQGFSVYAKKTSRPWRAAVVVSKKVHKSAVKRNRIRRRIYEVIRLYDKDHAIDSYDIVFIVHDVHIADMEYSILQDAVNKTLARAFQ